MTTFAHNGSAVAAIAVTATQTSLTLQFTDENGATVLGSTLSPSNYWINSSILSSGNGSADTLIGTSGNRGAVGDDDGRAFK